MPDDPYDQMVALLGDSAAPPPPQKPDDLLKNRVLKNAAIAGVEPDVAEDWTHVVKGIESGGKHYSGTNLLKSDMGATGVGQVMPDKPGGLSRTIAGRKYDLSDIDQNIQAGLQLFAAGGADPVARRLEYFGGRKARNYYETHGAIPPGGEWATDKATGKKYLRTSFHKYVNSTLQKDNPKSAYNITINQALPPQATPSIDFDQINQALGMDTSEPDVNAPALETMAAPAEKAAMVQAQNQHWNIDGASPGAQVLAHVAGPSGSGKTEIMNALGDKVKNIDLVDLDQFDDAAVAALGWTKKLKGDFTDKMLDQLHAKRQEMIDEYVRNGIKPIVFFGHHIEGENETDIPTLKRIVLDVSPETAAMNANRRPGKTQNDIKKDIGIGREDIQQLQERGYEAQSPRKVFSEISQLSKGLPDDTIVPEKETATPSKDFAGVKLTPPHTGMVGQIVSLGPVAEKAYRNYIEKNVRPQKGSTAQTVDSAFKDESNAHTFIAIQKTLAATEKGTRRQKVNGLAQVGIDFLKDPDTSGKVLPNVLHAALIAAHLTPEQYNGLPNNLKAQIRAYRQRKAVASRPQATGGGTIAERGAAQGLPENLLPADTGTFSVANPGVTVEAQRKLVAKAQKDHIDRIVDQELNRKIVGIGEFRQQDENAQRQMGMGEFRQADEANLRQQKFKELLDNSRDITRNQIEVEQADARSADMSDFGKLHSGPINRQFDVEAEIDRRHAVQAQAEEIRQEELALMSPQRKAQIPEDAKAIIGNPDWLNGPDRGLTETAGAIVRTIAGALDTYSTVSEQMGSAANVGAALLTKKWANQLRGIARQSQEALAIADSDAPLSTRQEAARVVTHTVSALSTIIPFVSVLGPVAGFAAHGALTARGNGLDWKQTGVEALKGGTLGLIFKAAPMFEAEGAALEKSLLTRGADYLKTGGVIGAGTFGVEKLFGADNKQAASSAITNVLLHGFMTGIPEASARFRSRLAAPDISSDKPSDTSAPTQQQSPVEADKTPDIVRPIQEPDAADSRFAHLQDSELEKIVAARPKKGTKADVRQAFADMQKAARAELDRRAGATPAQPAAEPNALPAGQTNVGDIPSFQEFVEQYPRGGVPFDSLTPDDPLFIERAKEYVQQYGGGRDARTFQIQPEGRPDGATREGVGNGVGEGQRDSGTDRLRDGQQTQEPVAPQVPVQEGNPQGQDSSAQNVEQPPPGVVIHPEPGGGRSWIDDSGRLVVQTPEQVRAADAQNTVSETKATIEEQMKALVDGREQVVLITPGDELPKLPEGFTRRKTSVGTFIFDPKVIKAGDIQRAVKDGTWHTLLGHLEPKSDSTTSVVTARTPEGDEAKTSVTTPGNEADQAAELKTRYPDATIETGGEDQAQKVIDERTAPAVQEEMDMRSPEEKKAQDRLNYLGKTVASEIADIDKRVGSGRLQSEDAPWRKKAALQRANDERDGILGRLPKDVRASLEKDFPIFADDNLPTAEASAPGEDASLPAPKPRTPSSGFRKANPAVDRLHEAVQAAGGIKTDADGSNAGETKLVKQSGVRRLVNEKSGKSVNDMAVHLAEEGYGRGVWWDGDYVTDVDPNAFLKALQDDASGSNKMYSSNVDVDFVEAERQHWLDQMTPEEQAEYEKGEKFATNAKAQKLLEAIANGDKTEKTYNDLRKIARRIGISKAETDAHIEYAEGRRSEAGPGSAPEMASAEDNQPPPVEQASVVIHQGPGTANIGDVPLDSAVAQLTEAVKSNAGKRTADERVRVSISDRLTDAKDSLTRAFLKARAASASIYDSWAHLPAYTDFKKATGEWLGANQRADFEVRKLVHAGKKAVPNSLTREAMLNWIEADGDVDVLNDRASKSKGRIKRGYEAATKLTDQEQSIARNIQSYYETRLQEGIDAGILEHGIEDYVNHIWKKENPVTKQLRADLQTGKLQPNFKFAKKRIFESDFEGEQLGHVSPTKDIFDRVGIYDQAFNRAVASRGYIKALFEAKASDGRPLVAVSGSGRIVDGEGGLPESVILKPKTKTSETQDYRAIDHPALRKWKWATQIELEPGSQSEVVISEKGTQQHSEESIPVVMQGEMLVHPEVYKHMKNMFSTSALRTFSIPIGPVEFAPGRALLGIQSTIKQTMLSVSPFHMVQEEVHALGHRVNLANMKKIDFADPVQSELVSHGLMIADYNAAESFSEGLAGGNLTNKIPVIGTRLLKPYQEWLFQDHIPKLKMNMALHALDRNLARYAKDIESGKVNRDQILELTAKQGNAAFGELNYKMMGRNPTLQDAFRAFVLAPDFLEARAKFAGQALKPYGREQFVALGGLAAAQFITARVVNSIINNGDPHWDRPFSVVYGEHEFALRTVPGDIIHLVTDPRSFFNHRLSPLMKAAEQARSGRDDRGQKMDAAAQIKDFIQTPIPIAFRKRQNDAWWESFVNATGLTEKRYRTRAEEMMRQHFADTLPQTPQSDADKERYRIRRGLEDRVRAGENVDQEINDAIERSILKPEDEDVIARDSLLKPTQLQFKKLPVKFALDVYDAMTDDEKADAEPILVKKYWNSLHRRFKGLSEEEIKLLEERIKKLGIIKEPSAVTTSPTATPSPKSDLDHLQELLGP